MKVMYYLNCASSVYNWSQINCIFVFAVFPGVIGFIGGRDALYCSHTDVVRTFLNPPTAYTTITGN